ncbi:hypothetical protein TREAZ_2685 [Leadbettera azotonutricia ZAS-9]|uniref:Uncharacterized protein n=1 Tax=Leadbettera azotonutricia (strain ATCC BAA-888 / DSM 13862 / ZAS-9) TaxID=545695 RepID=F5YDS9_LEAAZ|nr:hypothetical protein TREAZ_2685 [Leadbettera azotonutricia ZAS-9]
MYKNQYFLIKRLSTTLGNSLAIRASSKTIPISNIIITKDAK